MGKFISIPLCGTASGGTLAVAGVVTVANGAVTAVANGTLGSAQNTAPIVAYNPPDNQGSGAIISATYALGAITGYTIINGGSGYSTTTTNLATLVYPPFMVNAEKILSITYGVPATTDAKTNVLILRMDTPTNPTLTLTFATATAAVQTDFAFLIRKALIDGIMSANNVKEVAQVTPITLPLGAVLITAAYS